MSAPTAPTELRAASSPPPAAKTLPRLLRGIREDRALSLSEHVHVHGPLPGPAGRGRRHARSHGEALIEEVAQAGLLGRGGAAFPAATKLRAVAAARGRAIVVANGTEGEPASLKDQTLLEMLPHLVIDGAIVAAEAVAADAAVLATCELAGEGALARAIEERERDPAHHGPHLQLVTVPSHYVAGQESALVAYLNGGAAKPTFTPPLPFQQGVARRPTLVSNVETLAHMALIARHGAAWFRELGMPSQPGSALVTLSGAVRHPGVYEIEHGASLSSLIEAGGGATGGLRGALLGGYSGSWVDAGRLPAVALSDEHLAPHAAALGAGVVLLLSAHACPVAETARLAAWLADQSARQCGPCVHGLNELAGTLAAVVQGAARDKPGQRLDRLAALISRRGACGHPDGAVNVVFSALQTFRAEFGEHARGGACEACGRPPELPFPARAVSDERGRRLFR